MKGVILNSLKESFLQILRNKRLFVLLLALQIIFFAVFSFINLEYQTKILESANAITDYLSQQKLDEASVASDILQQKNIFGGDPLSISRDFGEILKNFRIYIIYIFVLAVVFASIAWAITCSLIYKNNLKQSAKNFFKAFVILSFYLGLIFAFFYSLLNISLTGISEESTKLLTKYIPFFIFSIVLAYFMFISLSLLHRTELKNIVQKTLSIGIKKIHYVLSVYFINILLFAVSIFLLMYLIESNLFILLLSVLLMIFSFIFGRIFMVNAVEKLEEI